MEEAFQAKVGFKSRLALRVMSNSPTCLEENCITVLGRGQTQDRVRHQSWTRWPPSCRGEDVRAAFASSVWNTSGQYIGRYDSDIFIG